jgi:hypothetical protein
MTKQLELIQGDAPRSSSTGGRLDARTREVGRIGLSQARAALAAASARAAARDAARLAARDDDLARRAAAAAERHDTGTGGRSGRSAA